VPYHAIEEYGLTMTKIGVVEIISARPRLLFLKGLIAVIPGELIE
jgi:hypothetical protein